MYFGFEQHAEAFLLSLASLVRELQELDLLFLYLLSCIYVLFEVGGGIEPRLLSVKDLISIRIPRDEWKNIQQSTCAPTF